MLKYSKKQYGYAYAMRCIMKSMKARAEQTMGQAGFTVLELVIVGACVVILVALFVMVKQ